MSNFAPLKMVFNKWEGEDIALRCSARGGGDCSCSPTDSAEESALHQFNCSFDPNLSLLALEPWVCFVNACRAFLSMITNPVSAMIAPATIPGIWRVGSLSFTLF